jgi:hypothetical protein
MATNQIQFRASEQMIAALQERSEVGKSPSLVAEEMIEAYLYLLQVSLPKFTENEAMLIVDAMNGVLLDYHTASLLWANIDDAIRLDGLAEKWQVDGPTLVARVRSMTPFEQWAIYDAVRRAWNSETYRIDNMEERVHKVGLVR